ncbi:S8 family serine peptidase [Bdellovibrio sp. SKB1291214]|uniref:S8 family serine peptidase n=1 Tax=Bdellovibrio sp. SKB1291214 TaxID=1732569 RepID=UPI000B515C4A|nr:S8 family serine peptidase [Bdellovibrio sp. SKB1291214]
MNLLNLNTQQRYFSTLLISLLVLGGCGPTQPDAPIFKSALLDGLYSTRPTVEEPEIFIIKLTVPALLETAKLKNGKPQLMPQQAEAISEEQEQTIAELKKISPDIRVLIRYRLVLNGLVVWAPADTLGKIKSIPNVILSEKSGQFARLQDEELEFNKTGMVTDKTSVKFIGAEAAYAQNIRGQGMRIGVIDTGIDYTHKMLGGNGSPDTYKAINPSTPTSAFPNDKVVGGIDLVGSEYSPSSPNVKARIPVPDVNPLDEATHGTHVAGTVAGLGDGINTYDGVAPDASLYAIKVFGAKGGTSDEVVIAALEYAADPTCDLSFEKQLDVVNLSLGSNYGNPHIMYNHAIKNLVRGGTVVVASGGNSGDSAYIVGAPGISDDAISVASSIDNMVQNISAAGAEFSTGDKKFLAEFTEAQTSKPLAELKEAQGEVLFVGLADKDFDGTTAAQIQGKIALMDRGVVSFSDKIKRAQDAGAIGVIVANNAPGDTMVMAGETKFSIPAVMISQDSGAKVKAMLAASSVLVNLKPSARVDKSYMADTISPFSSRGPRSDDGLIKPEIAAPGTNIISAARGSGDKGASMSGTSMAGPHIAGVMGLLKQKFPELSPLQLKSVLLGHGKVISDKERKQYSVSRQGAGRVQVAESLKAQVITTPSTLSFGLTDIENQKTLAINITMKNISDEAVTLTPLWKGSSALQVSVPAVSLEPGQSKTLTVTAKVIGSAMKSANEELDGFLNFNQGAESLLQIPALVVARQISRIEATSLKVLSTSADDAAGSVAELKLVNKSINKGEAYLFNLLGKDARKKDAKPDSTHNKNCDLQSAGYRVITGQDGKRYLQVGLKLYEGMTTWHRCEVNVQIDSNGDGLADQEMSGMMASDLPGFPADQFMTMLLNANKAREIRKGYEAAISRGETVTENYGGAVVDMLPMATFDNSTLAIITADTSFLQVSDTGELRIKISTTHNDFSSVEYDDYLGDELTWSLVSLGDQGQAYVDTPEVIELSGQSQATVSLKKGYGTSDLVIYTPQNKSVRDTLIEDAQSQTIQATYEK